MNEFKFWRWTVRPAQPEITHVVKDELPGAVSVVIAPVTSTVRKDAGASGSGDASLRVPREGGSRRLTLNQRVILGRSEA